MQFSFLSDVSKELKSAVRDFQKPIAQAATAAMKEAADTAVSDGRSELANAGFSIKSQKAFTSKLYPKGGKVSLSPSARVYHRIGYFRVFEEGATITGKPKLWLPLDTVPFGAGGRQLTPKQYVQRIGQLRSVNRPGRVPMLVGRAGRATIARATEKVTRLRKGALSKGVFGASIPLFVGIDIAKISKRLDLYGAIERAAERLGEFYEKNVKI